MASSTVIPTFTNPCIASFITKGSTQIYLAGVSDVSNGLLEVYIVDIVDIQTPVSISAISSLNTLYWRNNAPKACSTYPGDSNSNTAALHVQQFGPFTSYDANILPSLVVEVPSLFEGYSWVSPKNYAIVGDAGPFAFAVALTNQTTLATNSPWAGIRLNGTRGLDGTMNPKVLSYPVSTPLISLGTYTPNTVSPARGYLTVFDNAGSGKVYAATGYDKSNPLITDLLTLGIPQTVDMNNIKLTLDAIPVNIGTTGYILDKAADGSTVVYSINPGQSNKMQVVTTTGDVLPFSANIVATSQSSQIITYRVDGTTASFNSFNPTTGKWAGIGLKAPPPKPSTSGNPSTPGAGNGGNGNGSGNSTSGSEEKGGAPIGAIVGGVVGGLVVVALVAFLFIRNRRQKKVATPVVPTYYAETSQQSGAAPVAAAADLQSPTPAYQESPYVAAAQFKQQQFQPQQQQQEYQPQQQHPQQYQPQQQQQEYQPQQQHPQQYQPQQLQQLQPQVFQQQQQQHVQPQQAQPGYADPRLSYNPYTAAPGQPPIIQQQQTGQHPNIFQPHQSVYSIAPIQSQQAYVSPPGIQAGNIHSQDTSPSHYQILPTGSSPGASIGSPSQTPVVYTPPTITGYQHPR
ncbi:hypothetical protein BGZ47_008094 [Haplosporangium gracile]|nr:hypothetical protein BGZ47_008094 [Haplosporangium gracile]